MGSQPPLLRWCLFLALAGQSWADSVPGTSAASDAAPVVRVSTAPELLAAIDSNAEHILVSDHIDLTEVEPFQLGEEGTAVFELGSNSSFASLRVRPFLQPCAPRYQSRVGLWTAAPQDCCALLCSTHGTSGCRHE